MDALLATRKAIKTEEFDYQSLMQTLRHYRKPRDVVTRLLHNGSIIRVKMGQRPTGMIFSGFLGRRFL